MSILMRLRYSSPVGTICHQIEIPGEEEINNSIGLN